MNPDDEDEIDIALLDFITIVKAVGLEPMQAVILASERIAAMYGETIEIHDDDEPTRGNHLH